MGYRIAQAATASERTEHRMETLNMRVEVLSHLVDEHGTAIANQDARLHQVSKEVRRKGNNRCITM